MHQTNSFPDWFNELLVVRPSLYNHFTFQNRRFLFLLFPVTISVMTAIFLINLFLPLSGLFFLFFFFFSCVVKHQFIRLSGITYQASPKTEVPNHRPADWYWVVEHLVPCRKHFGPRSQTIWYRYLLHSITGCGSFRTGLWTISYRAVEYFVPDRTEIYFIFLHFMTCYAHERNQQPLLSIEKLFCLIPGNESPK